MRAPDCGEKKRKRGNGMKEILYPRGVESARVIPVIETKTARGSGMPDQPARIVTEYWSLKGEKLAESDPIAIQEGEQ